MSWEDGDKQRRWTRREWVKLGMAAGTVAAVIGIGGLVQGQLLPPPEQIAGTIHQDIVYTRFPTPQWWNSKNGQSVRVSDFQLWEGATGVWQGVYQNGTLFPGTGLPCIIIRVPRDATGGTLPTAAEMKAGGVVSLPTGFDLVYDDGINTKIVVLFDRCVHLCCYPGWHVVTNPPPLRDYIVPPPTYDTYHEDPVYCICHGSQYDPLLLTISYNPVNNVKYVGAKHVHGPATRSLAVIPVQSKGGVLFGGMPDPRWYEYC